MSNPKPTTGKCKKCGRRIYKMWVFDGKMTFTKDGLCRRCKPKKKVFNDLPNGQERAKSAKATKAYLKDRELRFKNGWWL